MSLDGSLRQSVAPNRAPAEWQKTFEERLPLYGHRNWIIVADAAFPAYSRSGIETIVADQDLPAVLHYVARAISSSRHVRANVFLDQELHFIQEADYPGVAYLRDEIVRAFDRTKVSSIPHAQLLFDIHEVGKTFRILLIKTSSTIPYSSVYMRLDCGYMSDEVDHQIRNSAASASRLEDGRSTLPIAGADD
jgi:RbsD / FucU transport protein family